MSSPHCLTAGVNEGTRCPSHSHQLPCEPHVNPQKSGSSSANAVHLYSWKPNLCVHGYCNGILFFFCASSKVLDKLQYLQNSAAHVLTHSRSLNYVTPVLQGIRFKDLVLTHKALHDQAPPVTSHSHFAASAALKAASGTFYLNTSEYTYIKKKKRKKETLHTIFPIRTCKNPKTIRFTPIRKVRQKEGEDVFYNVGAVCVCVFSISLAVSVS